MEKRRTHYGLSLSDTESESDYDTNDVCSISSDEEPLGLGLHSPPGCLTSLFVDSCVKDITPVSNDNTGVNYSNSDNTSTPISINKNRCHAEHYLELTQGVRLGFDVSEEPIIVDHYKDIKSKVCVMFIVLYEFYSIPSGVLWLLCCLYLIFLYLYL